MSAPTRLLSEQTRRDTLTALAGLRHARLVGDVERERQWENRMNWLVEHVGKLIRGDYDR